MTSTDRQTRAEGKAQTQERLLRAATELFLQHGYKGASARAIAARAGVSRSLVFWHFGSKQALFCEVLRELLVPFRAALESTLGHVDARKRLFAFFRGYEAFVGENRETIRALLRWSFEAPAIREAMRAELMTLHRVFRREIQATLRELGERPEQAGALASGLLSLLHGNLMLELFDPGREGQLRSGGLETVARRVLGGYLGD